MSRIHGIGCDLIETQRVRTLYDRYGEKLLKRVLTPAEREQAAAQHCPIARLSKYLAAKEAAFKALQVGRNKGISWQDFEVSYAPSGAPRLALLGNAAANAPKGAQLHLSLSDTESHALAYVVIETP